MKNNRNSLKNSNNFENSENMNPCIIPVPQTDTVGDGRWMSIVIKKNNLYLISS